MNYIYALHDPITLIRRYIGKTNNPEKRYRSHISPSSLKADTYKNRWIKKLLKQNLKPIMTILSETEDDYEDINKIEKDYIRWLKTPWLTNGTPGGDGGPTMLGRKFPNRGPSVLKGISWSLDDPRRQQISNRNKSKSMHSLMLRALEKNLCYWKIISPIGVVCIVRGLPNFCKNNDLNTSKMSAVARGDENRTHHKGWGCTKINIDFEEII